MKKFNYLLLGLAGLAMASCSQDEVVAPGNGDGFSVTVQLPGNPATRAGLDNLSNGLTANVLHYAVYEYNATSEANTFLFEGEADFGQNLSTTVRLNLAAGMNYNIAFFAVSTAADGSVYLWNPNPTEGNPYIKVDYSKYDSANNLQDAYDCFYLFKNTGVISSTNNSLTALLQRPVAQINWGANDLNAATTTENTYGENGKYIVSNLTIEGMYTQFDMFESKVTGNTSTVEINGLASPMSSEDSNGWVYPVLPEQNTFIAMQYVLAPGYYGGADSEVPADVQGGVFNVTLNVNNSGNKNAANVTNEPINVYSCPLQADYRTNIYGSLLSTNTEFTVTKDQNWKSPDYDPSFEWALKNGGTFTLSQDITLSNIYTISKDLTINLNGHTITGPNIDGLFKVDGATLNIKGEGTIQTSGDYASILVWAYNNATVNIYSGTFQAYAGGEIIYIGGNSTGATVNIYGGTFIPAKESNGKYSCLNIQDAARDQAHMNVMGGTFYNWDPSDNAAEGIPTNFVSKGYKVVEGTSGTNTLYTVVPEDATVATDSESLKSAVSEAGSGDEIVVLPGEYTFPAMTDIKAEGLVFDCQDGVIFKGQVSCGGAETYNQNLKGAIIKNATFSNPDGVCLSGNLYATFENCTFSGANPLRWCYVNNQTTFTGCKFLATDRYAFHIDTYNPASTPKTTVYLNNCYFEGQVAVSVVTCEYTECVFESNGTYNGPQLYDVSVFTDCQFSIPQPYTSGKWFYVGSNSNTTLNNCFNNGELMTTSFGFYAAKGATVICNGQSKTF